MDRPDLNSYFQRIGCTAGPREATLDTLRALHLHHAQAIAFENLEPLSREAVKLDLPSLEGKLVHGGRGGYCYEHNLLFSHILRELGFRVTGLAARVLWNAPDDAIRARSHMLLRVDFGAEPYIADVGFGGQTLTGPLRLIADVVQPTPHEPYRLIAQDGDFVLQTQLHDSWKPLYRFDLQQQFQVDYEVSSWYLCNHPQSPFTTNLMAARPVPGGRYGLFNNQLTFHRLGGHTEQRRLGSTDEIRAALHSQFGLRVPANSRLEAALARLVA
ncbi:MAG: arylamine N-acetyltransferase family protein [Steroidobacteraceae bacterium]